MRNASSTAVQSSTSRSTGSAPGRGPALPVHGAGSSDPAAPPHAVASDGSPRAADSPWSRRLSRPAIILGATGAFLVAAQTFEPDWSRADDGTLGPTAMPVTVPATESGAPSETAPDAQTDPRTDPLTDGAVSLGRLEGINGTTLILGHADGPRWIELDANGEPTQGRANSADGPPAALREAIAEAPVLMMRATGDVPGW